MVSINHSKSARKKHALTFQVLVGEWVVWIGGFLVSKRTFFAALTFALHPERTDVRLVSLVVRRVSSNLQERLVGGHRCVRSECFAWICAGMIDKD